MTSLSEFTTFPKEPRFLGAFLERRQQRASRTGSRQRSDVSGRRHAAPTTTATVTVQTTGALAQKGRCRRRRQFGKKGSELLADQLQIYGSPEVAGMVRTTRAPDNRLQEIDLQNDGNDKKSTMSLRES